MKQIVFTLMAICFAATVNAQSIATDSKENPVLQLYSFKKARYDFSSKDFSVTLTSRGIEEISKFFFEKDKNNFNVKKTSRGFLQLSMLNASQIQSLSDFSGFRPGGKVRFTFQKNVDEIQEPNKENNKFTGAVTGGGFSLFASVDNIKLYNESTNVIEKRYPFSFGVEGNLNIFLPGRSRWGILSFNMSASNGWNSTELKNYKDIAGVTTTPTAVAFDKFDGKFGTLKTGLNNFRFSISLPINAKCFQFIPYAVHSSAVSESPSWISGAYLNIVLGEHSDFRKFKVPSAFGIGIDWIKKESKWTSPNIFIRGAFTIGEL